MLSTESSQTPAIIVDIDVEVQLQKTPSKVHRAITPFFDYKRNPNETYIDDLDDIVGVLGELYCVFAGNQPLEVRRLH